MPLSYKVYTCDENGFLRAPVLVSGSTEAFLIDGAFNFLDADRIIKDIQASGKKLTTIYITVNDPDFYFGLGPIAEAFPDAKVLAAPDTVQLMRHKADGKVAAWSPKLQDLGPKAVSDLTFPTATDKTTFVLDGEELHVINALGLEDRGRYFWVPSLKAVFGGAPVFGGMYPWVADLATPALRQASIRVLEEILSRKPEIVVPGHKTATWPLDTSGVTYTRDYLIAFDEEASKAKDSDTLIGAIKRRYPNDAVDVSLFIGAKVSMGEMLWD